MEKRKWKMGATVRFLSGATDNRGWAAKSFSQFLFSVF